MKVIHIYPIYLFVAKLDSASKKSLCIFYKIIILSHLPHFKIWFPIFQYQCQNGFPQSKMMNKRAVLNVGGERHEVLWRTLEQIPYSRLGGMTWPHFWDVNLFCRQIGCGIFVRISNGAGWLLLANRWANNTFIINLINLLDNEFFFDRHPRSFKTILNYYRTGRLHATDEMWVLLKMQ